MIVAKSTIAGISDNTNQVSFLLFTRSVQILQAQWVNKREINLEASNWEKRLIIRSSPKSLYGEQHYAYPMNCEISAAYEWQYGMLLERNGKLSI